MWIQYQENGIFIDYIKREDLQATLESRIQEVSALLFLTDTKEHIAKICKFLGIWHGNQDYDSAVSHLIKRGQSLVSRLDGVKLKSKEKTNGNINS